MNLLEKMVRTYSPSSSERNAVKLFIDELNKMHFITEEDKVGNAIGKIGSGPIKIYLVGHIDTVPGNLPVKTVDGKIYGRGSVDAKGCLCAFAEAAKEFYNSKTISITIVGCVREESDSMGAYQILKSLPIPDYTIIGEPSGWEGITLGYRGVMWLEFIYESSRFHHGAPEPTPAEVGIEFYEKIQQKYAKKYPSFDTASIRLADINTYQKKGNIGIKIKMDLRTPIGFDFDDFLSFSKSQLKGATLNHDEPIHAILTNKKNLLISSFLGSIRSQNGTPKFKKKTGSADMNILAAWNCPIIAYGPGDSSLDHTSNEYLILDEYYKSIEILKTAIKRLSVI